jgi:ribosomal-protein-alanine N-acetyltransferase
MFPQLSDARILMRALTIADIPQAIEISFYDGKPAENLETAISMQEQIDKDYSDGNTVHWGIFEQGSGLLVGTCGYYRGFANNSGELGCILLPKFRGQGYMSAALRLAIQFGIESMKLSAGAK